MWLIYALGSGFGHLTRACALARAAPHDVRVRILTNSPYAVSVQRAFPALELAVLDPALAVDEARDEVRRRIAAEPEACLIVDTFPRGLGGELVDIVPRYRGRCVLIRRDLNPRYSEAFELEAFVARSYELVLEAESPNTAAWLVRSCHELPARYRKRERPAVIVCAAGNPEELDWYGTVAAKLRRHDYDVQCVAPVCPSTCPPDCWLAYWPAIDLFPGADVVVGGGGYNTVYECLACRVPLVARPWPRKYDRQALRARRYAAAVVANPADAVAAVEAILSDPPMRERTVGYENGAVAGAAAIQRVVASSRRH